MGEALRVGCGQMGGSGPQLCWLPLHSCSPPTRGTKAGGAERGHHLNHSLGEVSRGGNRAAGRLSPSESCPGVWPPPTLCSLTGAGPGAEDGR